MIDRDAFPLREMVTAYDAWGADELRVTRKESDSSWTVVTVRESSIMEDPRTRHPDYPGIAIETKEVSL